MHRVEIGKDIVERVLARRGRYHLFDAIPPEQTALLIIDMQPTFLAPGAPAEVPAARNIVGGINALANAVRELGVTVIWCTHANSRVGSQSDWSTFFDHFVADEVYERTIDSLSPGAEGAMVWPELEVQPDDPVIVKNRYSALISGSSSLERMLRSAGLEYLLIGGTKTNVCCEATARDAMMLDFKVVMVSDCLAALSDREHVATLETVIQQFGDVMDSGEVLAALRRRGN